MTKKLLAALVLFCSAAYGATSTRTVGTATVRGTIQVDGNQVTSDATLFEGSTVATSEATATLRMDTHSVIEMAAGTRNVVYGNYVKLEQGKIDVKPTCGFVVEVNGVRVTPNSVNAHGVVSISGSGASVSSQSGEFFILDDHGRVLSTVRSGGSQSIGAGQAQTSSSATYVGTLTTIDRHPILTPFAPDTNVSYELQGKNADKIQGYLMQVDGTIDPKKSSVLSQVDNVIDTNKGSAMCTVKVGPYPYLIGAAAAAAVAGTAAAIAITNQPSTPASK